MVELQAISLDIFTGTVVLEKHFSVVVYEFHGIFKLPFQCFLK